MGARRKNRIFGVLRGAFLPLVAVVVLICFFTGISNLRAGSSDEGKKQLEESIHRAVAACYAAEGIYPPTVEYMEENYGLQVDSERFAIDYQIFASNLMPDVTVLERTDSPASGRN